MDGAIDKRTKAAKALGRINHTSLHCTLLTVCLLHLQISQKSPNSTPGIGTYSYLIDAKKLKKKKKTKLKSNDPRKIKCCWI